MITSMFRQVLCPVDLSSGACGALETAVRLAKPSNASVTAFYVSRMTTPIIGDLPYLAGPLPPLTKDERSRLEAEIDAFVAPARESGVRVRVEISEGSPGREIVARAGTLLADLVVVGTHGRSGVSRVLLGSVAEKVLHGAPCPVVTVGHGEPGGLWNAPIRRVVCAESLRHASRALEFALALADFSGADLVLAHAIEELPRKWAQGAAMFPYGPRLVEQARLELHAMVGEDWRRRHQVEEVVLTGRPHETIVECAHEQGADLVVLGVHDRSPWDLPFVGSTVDQVVRSAGCPVITVRGEVVRSLAKRDGPVAALVG